MNSIVDKLWRHAQARVVKPLVGRLFHASVPLVIVTGANDSHFKSLAQFIASVKKFEPQSRLVVYDLGLAPYQLAQLRAIHPGIDLRRFPFESYPPYFDITKRAGEYAWKPVIVETIADEFQECTVWMDGGNKLVAPLHAIRRELALHGIYSPTSQGTVAQWTHPLTAARLKVDPNIAACPNRNGAAIAFNPNFPKAHEVLHRWADAARDKDCIAPPGSDRSNHRQDQAVFSVLFYQHGWKPQHESLKLGFLTHQDVD